MSTDVLEKTKFKLKKPPMFCVVFFNNDTTSYEQVMFLLVNAFNMSQDKAVELTHKIDGSEKGVVFVNTKEVCDAKNDMVKKLRTYINETDLKHEVQPYGEETD